MKIIELLIPLIGVLIGWGCGELSKRFADKYQQKQTINKTISLLLELYFQIKRIATAAQNSQAFVEWYIAQFKGNAISVNDKEKIREVLSSLVNPLITEVASYDIMDGLFGRTKTARLWMLYIESSWSNGRSVFA